MWDQHEEEGFRLEMSSTSIIFNASLASAAPSITLTLVFLKLFPTLGVVVRSVVVDSDLIDSVANLNLIFERFSCVQTIFSLSHFHTRCRGIPV